MNKKFGWTLVELMVALSLIMIISGFLIANFRPKTQNTRIQAYAAIRNTVKGLIAVDDKYQKTPPADNNDGIFYQNPTHTTAGTSTFCLEMSDAFSLKETPNCNISATTGANRGVANLVLPNGVEIYGLASNTLWAEKSGAQSEIKYKNILIDVDGKKGSNKLGKDRFPLRIYLEDKLILPVNCNEQTDGFFDWIRELAYTGSEIPDNDYCKYGGKDIKSSLNSKQNFMLDEEMITYDTYRASTIVGDDKKTKGSEMVAFSQSLASSICGNFGGRRYLSADQCKALSKRIYTKCVMEEMCLICDKDKTCPFKLDGTTKTDPGEGNSCVQLYEELKNATHACLFLLHKPASGMSAFIEGMVGELDMD